MRTTLTLRFHSGIPFNGFVIPTGNIVIGCPAGANDETATVNAETRAVIDEIGDPCSSTNEKPPACS